MGDFKMTTGIQGNVYVIDSSGIYLTGSNATVEAYASGGNKTIFSISNIGLYGDSTSSELAISYLSDTTQVIYHLKTQAPNGGYDDIHFAAPHMVSEKLYVNTLTAGTGYIYFA
jgi:hypothetical protein